MSDNRPLGWVDESNPNGVGYQIMTEHGIKIFDKEDRNEYLKEKARIDSTIAAFEKEFAAHRK